MIKKCLVVILYLLIPTYIFAYSGGLRSHVFTSEYMKNDGYVSPSLFLEDEEKSKEIIYKLDSLYEKSKNLDYLSDIAYIYTTRKEYKEALNIYFKIESLDPDRYTTAINIVNTYESVSKNEEALEWFNKARKVRPVSNDKIELIYAKILDAKLKGISFIKSLNSGSLTGISFGEDSNPKSNLSVTELNELIEALEHHIRIRAPFSTDNNRILGLLFFELGNASAVKSQNLTVEKLFQEYLELDNLPRMRCGGVKREYTNYLGTLYYPEVYDYENAQSHGFNNPIIDKRIKFVKEEKNNKSRLLKEAIKRHDSGEIEVLGFSWRFILIGLLFITAIIFGLNKLKA